MSQYAVWENDSGFTQDDDEVNICEDSGARSIKFKVISYIPSKYHPKHIWYVAASILAIITLITIVAVFSSRSTASRLIIHPKLYFNVDNTRLVRYDLENDNLTSELEAQMHSTILSFEIGGSIDKYWIEKFIDGSRIVAKTNESQGVLLQERRFKPNALVFDNVSGNLYASDDNAGLLIAINVLSGDFLILLADIIRPRDIVLDSSKGLVFVLQHEHSIVRANLNGTNPIDIVNEIGITGLSADSSNKRIYWINDFVSIESSDYEGENRRIVFNSTTKIVSITVSDNKLYWIERNERDNTTLLLFCDMSTDKNCEKPISHKIGIIGNVLSIRSYVSTNKASDNPCVLNNGGCEQFCLLSGGNETSCACRMGWQLKADNRTCEEVDDFLLYVHDTTVRTCTLDGSRELFWPTPYSVDKLTVKTEIDFEYDLKNDYFYFTDDHHIHRMKLKAYSGQDVILSVMSDDLIIDDIAYDWYTGNMYYGQRHVDATLQHTLVMFNTRLGEFYRKSINIFDQDDFKARSYALALHPGEGYLFVAVTHEDERDTHVFRTKLDGTDFTRSYHFYAEGIQDHRFFAVDYESDRVYAIQETGEYIWIVYVKIQSTGMQFPEHPNIAHARTIAVHQHWLYVSNSSSIYRFDKENGEDPQLIAPRNIDDGKKIIGVRIISKDVQFTGSDNPCAKDNGGCEQLCFSGAQAICDCKDGQKVDKDGRCYAN